MKDSRFIELVNLYIDRQISAGEAAELEHEIQSNPRRRAIYRQYCQMHRATKLVYESFRNHSAEPSLAAPAGGSTITRLENRRRRRLARWVYFAAAAAAACLTVVFSRINAPQATAAGLMASLEPRPAAPSPAVVPAMPAPTPAAAPAAPTIEIHPGLVSLRQGTATVADYAALLAAMRQEEQQQAIANNRIRSAPSAPLFDDGVFESQQILPTGDSRVYRARQTPAQKAEFSGYQFQR
jgi:hypothetical protein